MNTQQSSKIDEQNVSKILSDSIVMIKSHVGVPKIIEDYSQIPELNQLKSGLMFSEQQRVMQMQEVNPLYTQPNQDRSVVLQPISQIRGIYTQRTDNSIIEASFIMNAGHYVDEKIESKEGFILKKTKKILQPFKQLYCHFQDGILSFYINQTKSKATIILNLMMFNFQYYFKELQGLYEFGLKCVNHDKVFQFKETSDMRWFKVIKQHIDDLRKTPKAKFYIDPFTNFYKKRLITNQQFIGMCQTGDIILFQGKSCSSKIQRIVTRSNYGMFDKYLDHVGMILKYQSGTIYILEATDTLGVGIFDWSSMISEQWYELYSMQVNYKNRVVYRQLQLTRSYEFIIEIEKFVKENLGKSYKLSVSKLMTNKSSINTQQNEDHTYFCSQLIAKVYKKLGLLDSERSANQYWPGSFSNEKDDLKLHEGSLSDEYLIGFNM